MKNDNSTAENASKKRAKIETYDDFKNEESSSDLDSDLEEDEGVYELYRVAKDGMKIKDVYWNVTASDEKVEENNKNLKDDELRRIGELSRRKNKAGGGVETEEKDKDVRTVWDSGAEISVTRNLDDVESFLNVSIGISGIGRSVGELVTLKKNSLGISRAIYWSQLKPMRLLSQTQCFKAGWDLSASLKGGVLRHATRPALQMETCDSLPTVRTFVRILKLESAGLMKST